MSDICAQCVCHVASTLWRSNRGSSGSPTCHNHSFTLYVLVWRCTSASPCSRVVWCLHFCVQAAHTHTHTHTQSHTFTHTERGRETGRQTGRQTDRQTETARDNERQRQTDSQSEREGRKREKERARERERENQFSNTPNISGNFERLPSVCLNTKTFRSLTRSLALTQPLTCPPFHPVTFTDLVPD